MPSTEIFAEELLPVAHAARHARNVVTGACLRWDLGHLTGPATLIVTELVGNVVQHAHTMMTLEVTRRGGFVRITVRDGSSAPPVARRDPDLSAPGGLGLRLVAHSSADWGYRAEAGGKAVWATLAVDDSAAA